MNRLSCSLVLLSLLCACSAAPSPTGPSSFGTTPPTPIEPLGGLSFRPLSSTNAHYASAGGASMPGLSPNAMPTVVPSASALSFSGGPTSGNIDGYYDGSAFGATDANGPMALVSITETETVGADGPFSQVVKRIAAPLLKDWASDGRLISSNGQTEYGLPPTSTPSPLAGGNVSATPVSNSGGMTWRFTYLSPSRHETLQFIVSPSKTLVLRTRWAPLVLDPAGVAVDSDAAIQKLSAAIADPTFQGEEEKSSKDYFMGTAFGAAAGVPTIPPPGIELPRIEAVYHVPKDARWNVNLRSIMGKTVWEMNFYALPDMVANPEPNSSPFIPLGQSEYQFDNSASGMVDAETGAVIRFRRPAKRYYPQPTQPFGSPGAIPVPSFIPATHAPMPMPSA